jgi:hypothetical protein
MLYTEQELYAGNRNGQPLDPLLYQLSMDAVYGRNKPPAVQPIQQPLEISSKNRSRLTTQSRKRRSRTKAQRGKRALTTGLNTGAVTGGSTGGVSF